MGTGAVRGYTDVRTQVIHVSANGLNAKMACEACAVNFTIFKRKKTCGSCGRNFCSQCILRQLESQKNRQCQKCKVLLSGSFTKRDLMNWKIRDLRVFLNHQHVSTEMCREKHDLVDLLVRHFGSSSTDDNNSDHERHLDNLRERRRQSYAEQIVREAEANARNSSSSSSQSTDTPHQGSNTNQQLQQDDSPYSQNSHQSTIPPSTQADRLQERREHEMREAEIRQQSEFHEDENEPSNGPAMKRMTLDKIASEDELDNLNVRQLKELLVGYFVNYKGCVEKWELLERAKRLWKEDLANKEKVAEINNADNIPSSEQTDATFQDDDICKICMDAPVDCVLLECGHMVSCTQCGRRLAECPVCRHYVVRVVHTFKS